VHGQLQTLVWAIEQSLGTIEHAQSPVYVTNHVDHHLTCCNLEVFLPHQVVLPEAVARVIACQTSPLQQVEQFILDFRMYHYEM